MRSWQIPLFKCANYWADPLGCNEFWMNRGRYKERPLSAVSDYLLAVAAIVAAAVADVPADVAADVVAAIVAAAVAVVPFSASACALAAVASSLSRSLPFTKLMIAVHSAFAKPPGIASPMLFTKPCALAMASAFLTFCGSV